jgi:uncharacterized protein (DUF2164 family)
MHSSRVCLIEDKALKDMMSNKAKYAVITMANVPGAPAGAPADTRYDGLTFLWRIIQQSTAQTNTTVGVLVNYLTNLKEVMIEHNFDAKEFNTSVNTKLSSYYTNKQIRSIQVVSCVGTTV